MSCVYEDCETPVQSRGRCSNHYRIDRASGALPKITEADRFWAKVEKADGCWMWGGSFRTDGYGQIRFQGRNSAAHRVSYTLNVGPIPDGMFIDHICHVKACVKPAHLRLATCRQNNEYRQGPQSNSTTGVRGVSWDKDRGRWVGQVFRNRKPLFFGRFDSKEEAEEAVKAARAEHFDFPEAA